MPDPAFIQRFARTRFGWRVSTERVGDGMATGPGVFAFTPAAAKRKGERIVAAMVQDGRPFMLKYDGSGRPIAPAPLKSDDEPMDYALSEGVGDA